MELQNKSKEKSQNIINKIKNQSYSANNKKIKYEKVK